MKIMGSTKPPSVMENIRVFSRRLLRLSLILVSLLRLLCGARMAKNIAKPTKNAVFPAHGFIGQACPRSFCTFFASAYLRASIPSPVTAEMGNNSNFFFLQYFSSRCSLFSNFFGARFAAALLLEVLAEPDFFADFFFVAAFLAGASSTGTEEKFCS